MKSPLFRKHNAFHCPLSLAKHDLAALFAASDAECLRLVSIPSFWRSSAYGTRLELSCVCGAIRVHRSLGSRCLQTNCDHHDPGTSSFVCGYLHARQTSAVIRISARKGNSKRLPPPEKNQEIQGRGSEESCACQIVYLVIK